MSMAGLAMRNQVNANQLRRWVHLHQRREAGGTAATRLLPVTVVPQDVPKTEAPCSDAPAVVIELAGAVVRVHDGVVPATLRVVLDALRGMTP
jgi:transposase-like protein